MSQDLFAELEKIANSMINPEDLAAEPMTQDPMPQVPAEEVEATQGNNSAVNPIPADAQLPASPEDAAALEAAVADAQGQLAEAKEVLAQAENTYAEFEKIAEAISETLPGMGALARLIDYSTNENIDEVFKKEASDRLMTALKDEESYSEVLTKTAGELFGVEGNLDQLYSREGMEYVIEQLASFAEDEELEKSAFELGGILTKVKETAGEYVEATQKFHKIQDEINAAKVEVDRLSNIATEKTHALERAQQVGDPDLYSKMLQENADAHRDWSNADSAHDSLVDQQAKGRAVVGAGAAGLVGGALFGGKKLYDATQNKPEEELSTKVASVTMNSNDNANYEGGNKQMSVVNDFLKIAGAAYLLDAANDETAQEGIRKEAATAFNQIARMGRKDMEENFMGIAKKAYTEEQLHEIVAGKHNDVLFEKIAFFTDAYDMSADELEKVAGADGVAAKGVGGALTDAKANIVEKIEGDKKETETVANGELGVKKTDDMRGYHVINNPGEYQVDKTASLLEEAEMRKEAAFKEYVAMDTFLKNNKK